MPEIVVFVISLTAVIFGADWLGNAAVHISQRLYLPRIIVGATFVSVATTLPEISIGAFSAVQNQASIGIGTVFGSPITNIGLVLGILFLFSKTKMQEAYFVRTVQIFLAVLVLVFLVSVSGTISPFSGIILILFGIAYLVIEVVISRHEEDVIERIEHRFERLRDYFLNKNNFDQLFYLLAGTTLLLIGAHFLISSVTAITATFGIPQVVIGAILIAFGTSLPEIITAVNSIIKRRENLSVGNLFGASILDLTFALGLISILGTAKIDTSALYLVISTAAVLAIFSLVPVFGKISPKIAGLILIAIYLGFLVWFSGLIPNFPNL